MNHLKHMECTFSVVAATALLLAAVPDSGAHATAQSGSAIRFGSQLAAPSAAATLATVEQAWIAKPGTMAVVVIKGKRLSAREKRRAALAARAVAAPERG